MKFQLALDALQEGYKVHREIWNSDCWVVHVPAQASHVPQKFGGGYPTEATLWLKTLADTLMPFTPTHADLLADDWQLVGNATAATDMTVR